MKKGERINTFISNPWSIARYLNHRNMLKILPDKWHQKLMYRAYIGKKLNLKKPKTYNEKLQWIKLYDRKPEYTRNADKYAVRAYIAEILGEEYLIPLHGVYENTKDIDWGQLPDKFVLKATHGSGTNIICKDINKLDIEEASNKMDGWLHRNAYWYGREWCYKNIQPRIICEQFLETEDGLPPIDYKFMCFNGEPKLIQVHHGRGTPEYSLTYYSPEWKKTEIKRIDAPSTEIECARPVRLNEMLDVARQLSMNTYYARIDLYYESGHIYFGEITYYPTSGYSTFDDDETDAYLGSLIKLPMDAE